ncbi:MAG: phosphoribosylformylglycinamidine synthase [Sulfuricurvum sp. PC08-66]|nr:MAG: phosphoribosylformylglycinamidine synthase [Sulfuricurvum sp. PC08-66]
MQAIVNISLKNGVLDSQGKAVHHALDALKFEGVKNVRIGKQIVLNLETNDEAKAREEVTQMCEALLANTVIEEYTIELVK